MMVHSSQINSEDDFRDGQFKAPKDSYCSWSNNFGTGKLFVSFIDFKE